MLTPLYRALHWGQHTAESLSELLGNIVQILDRVLYWHPRDLDEMNPNAGKMPHSKKARAVFFQAAAAAKAHAAHEHVESKKQRLLCVEMGVLPPATTPDSAAAAAGGGGAAAEGGGGQEKVGEAPHSAASKKWKAGRRGRQTVLHKKGFRIELSDDESDGDDSGANLPPCSFAAAAVLQVLQPKPPSTRKQRRGRGRSGGSGRRQRERGSDAVAPHAQEKGVDGAPSTAAVDGGVGMGREVKGSHPSSPHPHGGSSCSSPSAWSRRRSTIMTSVKFTTRAAAAVASAAAALQETDEEEEGEDLDQAMATLTAEHAARQQALEEEARAQACGGSSSSPILSVEDVMSYCHKLVRGYGKNACWLTCPPPPPSHKGHPDEAGAPSSAYLTPGGAASNSSLSTLPFSTDARLPLACKRCLLQMRAVATAAMAHSKTDATLTTEGTEGTEGTAVWSEATDTPSLMMAPPPPLPQPLVAGTAPATHSGGRRKTWALTAQAVCFRQVEDKHCCWRPTGST
jgi:hypothetical protein